MRPYLSMTQNNATTTIVGIVLLISIFLIISVSLTLSWSFIKRRLITSTLPHRIADSATEDSTTTEEALVVETEIGILPDPADTDHTHLPQNPTIRQRLRLRGIKTYFREIFVDCKNLPQNASKRLRLKLSSIRTYFREKFADCKHSPQNASERQRLKLSSVKTYFREKFTACLKKRSENNPTVLQAENMPKHEDQISNKTMENSPAGEILLSASHNKAAENSMPSAENQPTSCSPDCSAIVLDNQTQQKNISPTCEPLPSAANVDDIKPTNDDTTCNNTNSRPQIAWSSSTQAATTTPPQSITTTTTCPPRQIIAANVRKQQQHQVRSTGGSYPKLSSISSSTHSSVSSLTTPHGSRHNSSGTWSNRNQPTQFQQQAGATLVERNEEDSQEEEEADPLQQQPNSDGSFENAAVCVISHHANIAKGGTGAGTTMSACRIFNQTNSNTNATRISITSRHYGSAGARVSSLVLQQQARKNASIQSQQLACGNSGFPVQYYSDEALLFGARQPSGGNLLGTNRSSVFGSQILSSAGPTTHSGVGVAGANAVVPQQISYLDARNTLSHVSMESIRESPDGDNNNSGRHDEDSDDVRSERSLPSYDDDDDDKKEGVVPNIAKNLEGYRQTPPKKLKRLMAPDESILASALCGTSESSINNNVCVDDEDDAELTNATL